MIAWAAVLLGFALGGLLDGLLNLAMSGLLILGVVLLWAGRADWPDAAPRAFWGAALAGFGGFQLFDAVVFHWGMGLHHVNKLSPEAVMAWDWTLFVLGVAATAGGAALILAARRSRY